MSSIPLLPKEQVQNTACSSWRKEIFLDVDLDCCEKELLSCLTECAQNESKLLKSQLLRNWYFSHRITGNEVSPGWRRWRKKNLIPEAAWRMLVLFLQEYGCRVKTVALDQGSGTGNDREEICCPSDTRIFSTEEQARNFWKRTTDAVKELQPQRKKPATLQTGWVLIPVTPWRDHKVLLSPFLPHSA